MTKKTRSIILVIVFAVLCVCTLAAAVLAVRFSQGTAEDGDGFLLIIFAACAVFDVLTIRILS